MLPFGHIFFLFPFILIYNLAVYLPTYLSILSIHLPSYRLNVLPYVFSISSQEQEHPHQQLPYGLTVDKLNTSTMVSCNTQLTLTCVEKDSEHFLSRGSGSTCSELCRSDSLFCKASVLSWESRSRYRHAQHRGVGLDPRKTLEKNRW